MAQMTRFVSFRAVLIITTHINPCCGIKLYIEPKNDQLVHKKHVIILKKHVPRA